MSKLAIFGGSPVRSRPFPAYNVIGEDEIDAVVQVMRTGVLSKYLGAWHDDFFGGPEIQRFEQAWASRYEVDYAIGVNSATSGLYAAIGACLIEPGDEVIVPPLSMSASATAPLIWGGIPVFADVDPNTFNLSAASIEKVVTDRTKAIVVVHLFGYPADMQGIMAIARKYGLRVIEDCAQALDSRIGGRLVGSFGDVGVFSLNYHKHIHTGEGGLCIASDAYIADRIRMIRNHAEAVLGGRDDFDLCNMVGFNFRLGEIEAAIGSSLLPKVEELLFKRRENVCWLEKNIYTPEYFSFQDVPNDTLHSYYAHPALFDANKAGYSRDTFLAAVKAELPLTLMREEAKGPLIGPGYSKPLYHLPIFKEKIAFGSKGYPFNLSEDLQDYSFGLCPDAEVAASAMITHEMMRPGMRRSDLQSVCDAFSKVFDAREELANYERGIVS